MERKFLVLVAGLSMLFASFESRADDNVCIINNASVAITASGGEAASVTYKIPANGGDQNKCWAFELGMGDAKYGISVNWGGDPDSDKFIDVGFTNPDIGAGYFTTEPEGFGEQWAPNDKICHEGVCVWHTGKTDVWRLYVEDAPKPKCESALDPCYNG
jgi:hypothetical protein